MNYCSEYYLIGGVRSSMCILHDTQKKLGLFSRFWLLDTSAGSECWSAATLFLFHPCSFLDSVLNASMPRKCQNPSRRQYSRDLKLAVIHQTHTLGYKSTKIAIELDIPLRVVQRIRQNWKEIRDVCKEGKRVGRSPLMKPDACKVCTGSMFKQCPYALSHSLCLDLSSALRTSTLMKYKMNSTSSTVYSFLSLQSGAHWED